MSFQIGLTTITHIVSYQICAHDCDLDELEITLSVIQGEISFRNILLILFCP